MKVDEVKLNQEKMQELLDPKRKPGRVRKVEQAVLLPRRCAITGRHSDRYFIDLGVDTGDFMGQVYICADIAEDIARIAGYIPPDALRDAYDSNVELAQMAIELYEENKKLKEILNGLGALGVDSPDVSELLRNALGEAEQGLGSEDLKRESDVRETEESGSDEQSDEQGMGNLPNISFTSSAPAI